jgi:uncharacterized protein
MAHFVYRLIPPRPTFAADMNDAEAEVMGRHSAYWRELLAHGRVVVFGPVADPNGVWGLGVFEAEDEAAARALVRDDPAISSGTGTFELYSMAAVVRT